VGVRRIKIDEAPMRPSHPDRWIGDGRNYLVSQALGLDDLEFNALALEPGTRTKPHTHTADQIIYQVRGTGIVAVGGGPDERVEAGECVLLPADVPHMHGAAEDGTALVVTALRAGFETDFACDVPPAWARYRA
jgi:quercetin dioxygenase-like cupin family protein